MDVSTKLPKKLKFVHPQILRVSDYVFEKGKTYSDLPSNSYFISLWKQGFFEEVTEVEEVEQPKPQRASRNERSEKSSDTKTV